MILVENYKQKQYWARGPSESGGKGVRGRSPKERYFNQKADYAHHIQIILLLNPAHLIFRTSYGPGTRGVERNAEKCNKSHPLQTIKVQRSTTVHAAPPACTLLQPQCQFYLISSTIVTKVPIKETRSLAVAIISFIFLFLFHFLNMLVRLSTPFQ